MAEERPSRVKELLLMMSVFYLAILSCVHCDRFCPKLKYTWSSDPLDDWRAEMEFNESKTNDKAFTLQNCTANKYCLFQWYAEYVRYWCVHGFICKDFISLPSESEKIKCKWREKLFRFDCCFVPFEEEKDIELWHVAKQAAEKVALPSEKRCWANVLVLEANVSADGEYCVTRYSPNKYRGTVSLGRDVDFGNVCRENVNEAANRSVFCFLKEQEEEVICCCMDNMCNNYINSSMMNPRVYYFTATTSTTAMTTSTTTTTTAMTTSTTTTTTSTTATETSAATNSTSRTTASLSPTNVTATKARIIMTSTSTKSTTASAGKQLEVTLSVKKSTATDEEEEMTNGGCFSNTFCIITVISVFIIPFIVMAGFILITLLIGRIRRKKKNEEKQHEPLPPVTQDRPMGVEATWKSSKEEKKNFLRPDESTPASINVKSPETLDAMSTGFVTFEEKSQQGTLENRPPRLNLTYAQKAPNPQLFRCKL